MIFQLFSAPVSSGDTVTSLLTAAGVTSPLTQAHLSRLNLLISDWNIFLSEIWQLVVKETVLNKKWICFKKNMNHDYNNNNNKFPYRALF